MESVSEKVRVKFERWPLYASFSV